MTRDEALKSIQERFPNDMIEFFDKSPKRVFIEIKPEAIVPVARHIFRDLGARFNIASGVDTRTHIEILYHFTMEDINLLITVRVKLNQDNPEIDSLAPSFHGANWIEREIHELLGVNFKGHPDLRRLLLPEQWPQGVYPLRRDYEEWDKAAVRNRGV